jgi:hypothetical protein
MEDVEKDAGDIEGRGRYMNNIPNPKHQFPNNN